MRIHQCYLKPPNFFGLGNGLGNACRADYVNHLQVAIYTSLLYVACVFMAMQFPTESVRSA